MKPQKGWAVLRDGSLFILKYRRKDADTLFSIYSPGSKHKWRVVHVLITELKPKR
jgi:hypothetical protein